MKINSDVLRGKNALVTGVNGGLGLAIAQELAAQGCNIIVTSRNAAKLTQNAMELRKSPVRIEAIPCDLSDKQAVATLVTQAQQLFPQIDILINCAGIFPVGAVADATMDDFELCFAVNVRAPFQLSKALLPQMKAKSWGRIVNIGSSSAFNGFKDTAIYCASKHALLGFSRSLYQEVRPQGVRVISLNPGSIRTEMGKKVRGQIFETFLDPVEVAQYVIFAISFNAALVSEEIRLNRLVTQ